jgi:deoxyribonuclease-4
MRLELVAAAALGALAINIHVGSHRGAGVARGVDQAATAIARIVDQPIPDPVPRLVLEVSAGQGDSLGVTIEEIAAIIDAAERLGVERHRLGICLDTAHLWAAGYALEEPSAIDALLASVDATMTPDALAMVHLNDSRAARGSRQDRHEHLGAGRIGEAGLGHLVRHPRLAAVPIILETPDLDAGWDAVDMARIRSLLAGEPLVGAPDEDVVVVPVRGGGGARMHMVPSAPESA